MPDLPGGVDKYDFADYRDSGKPSRNAAILSLVRTIRFSKDLKEVIHSFDFKIKVTGDRPEVVYDHQIPSDILSEGTATALDAEGTLETHLTPPQNGNRILKIRFRRAVKPEEAYQFKFSYAVKSQNLVKVKRSFGVTLVYYDYQISDSPCKQLRVVVEIPPPYQVLTTSPAIDLSKGLEFSYEEMVPLESFNFLVILQKRGLTWRGWAWIASALGSGLIGSAIDNIWDMFFKSGRRRSEASTAHRFVN